MMVVIISQYVNVSNQNVYLKLIQCYMSILYPIYSKKSINSASSSVFITLMTLVSAYGTKIVIKSMIY